MSTIVMHACDKLRLRAGGAPVPASTRYVRERWRIGDVSGRNVRHSAGREERYDNVTIVL